MYIYYAFIYSLVRDFLFNKIKDALIIKFIFNTKNLGM